MSDARETGFELDTLLAADTAFVADWELSRVLLMDDARFPWLILVPRCAGLIELDDLGSDDRSTLLQEIGRAMNLLRATNSCDKLNVAMLGNVVRQLHVHVVARCETDVAWPGPVWGFGTAQRYTPEAREAWLARLRADHV